MSKPFSNRKYPGHKDSISPSKGNTLRESQDTNVRDSYQSNNAFEKKASRTEHPYSQIKNSKSPVKPIMTKNTTMKVRSKFENSKRFEESGEGRVTL